MLSERSGLTSLTPSSLPLSQPPHHAMPYRTSECVSSTKLGVVDNVLGWLANEVVHLSKPIPRSAPSSHPLIFQLLRRCRPPVSPLPWSLLRPTHGGCPRHPPRSSSTPPHIRNPPCRTARSFAHAGHSGRPQNIFTCSSPPSSFKQSRIKHHSSGADGRVGLSCAARDAHGRGSERAVDRCVVQDVV